MATTIVTKNGSGAPTASDLVAGELAVDLTNKRLYTEDSGGTVIEVGSNPYNFTANHNGSAKLATTATGIDVTGSVTATGIDVTGSVTADGLVTQATANTYPAGAAQIKSLAGDISYITNVGGNFLISNSSTSDQFVLSSAGNVGIGTTPAAGYRMDILGGSGYDDILRITGVGTNIGPRINLTPTGTGISRLNATANSLQLQTGGNPALTIDSSQNVGIGVADGDVTNDGNAARTYVGIIGTANRGRLNLGTTASNGADAATLAFTNGTNVLSEITVDTDVGVQNSGKMYINSTNFISFSTAGTERLRIDSVGVLQSNGYSVVASTARPASGTLRLGNLPSTSMLLDYDDQGQTIATVRNQYGSTADAAELSLDSGFITFNTGTSFTEAMRIDASGNLLVGVSTFANNTLGVAIRGASSGATDESIRCAVSSTGSVLQIGFYNANGRVGSISTSGSATAFNTSSDQRLKENIADADDAGSKVDAIQVRKFDWKADGSHQDYGMIAQELLEVAPEAVSGDPESEEMMGVDYSKLVPMMLKEIQSLRARVAQLES